jgi:excisionase family DNA binding protein
MTTIRADHLTRSAIVYIRQSTAYQVTNNVESGRRQYGLVERARQLGWNDVQVIDDDLGRSGGGITRPGFEKLLAAICERRVGAVLSIEASRLARPRLAYASGILWSRGHADCRRRRHLPSAHAQRPIGAWMKGTMSEMEVNIFRQRSIEAMKQKARRGELFLTVAVGYVKTDDDRIELIADRRVRDAITLVFSKFAELQTVRQVLVWMRHEQIVLPAIVPGTGERPLEWKLPVYHTLHHILTNPVYAGAYVFGRRGARVTIEAGRKRVIRSLRRNWSDWEILIKDHHEGYITWGEFERNQRLIADNANGMSYLGRGSVRRGGALLPGLFRCARCGRKLQVSYGGSKTFSQRYACRGAFSERAEMSCISFGGMRVDRAVAREVLDRLQPFGIEAALAAMESLGRERLDKLKQLENAIEQARFEAARARRQYDAVDPENRLVAADLERRWNEKLEALHALEEQLSQIHAEPAPSIQDADRVRLLALGDDLSRAWNSPGVTIETRKKIVRLLISEIIVDVLADKIALIIHWQGGDHTRLEVAKNKAGQTRWTTDVDIVKLVQVLARQMPDAAIAAALNRTRKFTGHANGWTRAAVCSLRHQRGIAIYRDGERNERGEMTLDEAAQALNVSRSTVRRMIDEGVLPADHPCPGAPWLVQAKDIERADIQQDAKNRRSRRPSSHDPLQNQLDL